VALAVDREAKLGEEFMASELVELCGLHDIDIPSLKDADEDHAKRHVGCLMRRCFKEQNNLDVDNFTITRAVRYVQRQEGGAVDVKTYTFTKA
jgi:hypothetical protein